MRKLGFKGYLMSQLSSLSGIKSSSLYTFSKLSQKNARLNDALALYLVLYTEERLRLRLTNKYEHLKSACDKLCGLDAQNLVSFLSTDSMSEYRSIHENYMYLYDITSHNNRLKVAMHKRITEIQKEKSISNYRIYCSLGLNPGNINAFLKNQDTSKVSIDTARNILSFVTAF